MPNEIKVTTRKKDGAPWIIEIRVTRDNYGCGMDVPDGPEVKIAVEHLISIVDEYKTGRREQAPPGP